VWVGGGGETVDHAAGTDGERWSVEVMKCAATILSAGSVTAGAGAVGAPLVCTTSSLTNATARVGDGALCVPTVCVLSAGAHCAGCGSRGSGLLDGGVLALFFPSSACVSAAEHASAAAQQGPCADVEWRGRRREIEGRWVRGRWDDTMSRSVQELRSITGHRSANRFLGC
jgi:hypothetical protein